MNSSEIIHFWFEEIDSKFWFQKNDAFDQELRLRFTNIFEEAKSGKTAAWRNTPEGRLAEIIVLDQFSRNMFRGDAKSFAQDELALSLAKEAVAHGADRALTPPQKSFLYMPYMHSESATDHNEAVKLFASPGLEGNLKFELMHKKIIDRFGRYPHRNQILGRKSTPEEIEFLKEEGSSF